MQPLPLLLLCAAALLLRAPGASAQGPVSVYKCPSMGSQRVLTNYGGFTFQLDLTPADSSYLQPSMDCGILVIGYSTNRWLITMETISLGAYQAEFSIQDGSVGGKQLATVTSAGTVYRQVGTTSGSFNVRLTTKSNPSGAAVAALGVKLTIELLDKASCPNGWYTAPGNTGYCYGVPKLAGNLTYDEATKGCNMVLANLVMGNFDYDSISSELIAAPSSVLNPKVAYWVGLYAKDGDLKFLNKYSTLDGISGSLCMSSSSSCNCVAYQSTRFYKDDCNSRRQYVCYMPRGGANSYYDVSNLIATGAAVVTIVAIVLTVGFILALLISLTVVLICCIRRNSEHRRIRRQGATATAAAGGCVLGYPSIVTTAPPPYPVSAQAPPYTINAAGAEAAASSAAAAPPYAVYANGAFDAGGGAGAEKPPAYNPDWSGERVPA